VQSEVTLKCDASLVSITLQFPEFDDIYCRYSYVYGHDWDISSVSLAVLSRLANILLG